MDSIEKSYFRKQRNFQKITSLVLRKKKKKMAVGLVIPTMLYHRDQSNVLILQDFDCYKILLK